MIFLTSDFLGPKAAKMISHELGVEEGETAGAQTLDQAHERNACWRHVLERTCFPQKTPDPERLRKERPREYRFARSRHYGPRRA